ncbi:hypothetical protein ACLMNJ_04770 [Streptomyces seoulensis]
MTESNGSTDQKNTAAKARRAADKATVPAARAADVATAKTDEAASAAKAGAAKAAEATSSVAHSAAKGVAVGRKAVVTASGQVAATARTAWTVIARRKLVAAGLGGGLAGLTAASYAVGRRAGRRSQGPLTRLTGGRI